MSARLGSQDLDTHGWLRLVVAAALVLVFLLTLEVRLAAGASTKACRVTNTSSGQIDQSLQSAVDAADRGNRLTVKGTCVGRTIIDTSLVITGLRTDKKLSLEGAGTPNSGRPILDGDGKGPVLRIKQAATVTIRGLIVQGGVIRTRNTRTGQFVNGRGAGVLNRGTLRLWATVVRDNWAWDGGGIYNAGVLRLRGATWVWRNSASPFFPCLKCMSTGTAGLYNVGIATLSDASSIRNNIGAGATNHGRLTLNGTSSIQRNGWGVTNYGTLTMNDSSSIRGNRGMEGSQGVNSDGGDVTMNDASSIAGHRDGYYTWGLNMYGGGTLTMSGSSIIHDNRAENDLIGGGLGSGPDITLVGVTCGPGGNVYDNYPDDCYFR